MAGLSVIPTFTIWLENQLLESDTRYSIEVNYRTQIDEVLKNTARITLGYVSAALKKADFHVKQVFEVDPVRILVSARNWDDGEWVGVVSWCPKDKHYLVSKGYYNKDRKTVSIQDTKKSSAESAAEVTKEMVNLMHGLKNKPDRHVEKLKPVPLKTGPK